MSISVVHMCMFSIGNERWCSMFLYVKSPCDLLPSVSLRCQNMSFSKGNIMNYIIIVPK